MLPSRQILAPVHPAFDRAEEVLHRIAAPIKAPHLVVPGEGLLRRIDAGARAEPEIVAALGIVGDTLAARRRIGGDEDQAELGADAPIIALSVTLALVQVNPDRYQITGSFVPATRG